MTSCNVLLLLSAVGLASHADGVAVKRSLNLVDYSGIHFALAHHLADLSPALSLATPQGEPVSNIGLLATAHPPQNEGQSQYHSASPLYHSVYHEPEVPVNEEFYAGYNHEEGKAQVKDGENDEEDDDSNSQYKFGYRVTDHGQGTEFGQTETREGRMTTGHYHVLLPDGRLQNVEYWSDHTGYHVHISYQGISHHIH